MRQHARPGRRCRAWWGKEGTTERSLLPRVSGGAACRVLVRKARCKPRMSLQCSRPLPKFLEDWELGLFSISIITPDMLLSRRLRLASLFSTESVLDEATVFLFFHIMADHVRRGSRVDSAHQHRWAVQVATIPNITILGAEPSAVTLYLGTFNCFLENAASAARRSSYSHNLSSLCNSSHTPGARTQPASSAQHKVKGEQYSILFHVADRNGIRKVDVRQATCDAHEPDNEIRRTRKVDVHDWSAFKNLLLESDAEYEMAFCLSDINRTHCTPSGNGVPLLVWVMGQRRSEYASLVGWYSLEGAEQDAIRYSRRSSSRVLYRRRSRQRLEL